MYLLSVCIPTRNRPKELLKTVKAIEDQIEAANALNEVEIVISDNTDRDELRLAPSDFPYVNLTFLSNDGNIGYARNVNKVFFSAKGTYTWLLADDDIPLDGAILHILNALRDQNPSRPINYLTYFTGAILSGKAVDNFYSITADIDYYMDGRDFLQPYWLSIIFISSNIFCREKMIEHAQKYNLFENVNDVFQNSLLSISFIDKLGGVKIIPKTLLLDTYRPKNYTPYTSINVPVIQYVKLLKQLESISVSAECIELIRKSVNEHLLGYGLGFVIRKIETDDHFQYGDEYKKFVKDSYLQIDTRGWALAFFMIFRVIQFNKTIGRFLVKLPFFLKRRLNVYNKIKEEMIEFNRMNKNSEIKISY